MSAEELGVVGAYYAPKKSKSWVWKHFKLWQNSTTGLIDAICMICENDDEPIKSHFKYQKSGVTSSYA